MRATTTATDLHAAQAREDIYRGFEQIDIQRHDLELARARYEMQRIEIRLPNDTPTIPLHDRSEMRHDRSEMRDAAKPHSVNERHSRESSIDNHQNERNETDIRQSSTGRDLESHSD
jgi:hypothetical protein